MGLKEKSLGKTPFLAYLKPQLSHMILSLKKEPLQMLPTTVFYFPSNSLPSSDTHQHSPWLRLSDQEVSHLLRFELQWQISRMESLGVGFILVL